MKMPPLEQQDKPPTLIQKLLPSLKTEKKYNPYKNFKAPFANKDAAETKMPFLATQAEHEKNVSKLQKSLDNTANAIPVNQHMRP